MADYLRSRQRRGRWFHYYRRSGKEISLEVHGLPPHDPRVMAAYWAEHVRWEHRPPDAVTPKRHTFAWAVDLYLSGCNDWAEYAESTKKTRLAILRRYVAAQGDRLLSEITQKAIEIALYEKGGQAAVGEYKALKPVFEHMRRLHIIERNPMAGMELDRPKSKGFPTADAEDIAAFIAHWDIGTVERLVFDLALYTGAARVDLAAIGRHNMGSGLLTFDRQKTGVTCNVPLTAELRGVIARTPDIAPTFILNKYGKPYTPESLGNLFRDAAVAVGMKARLHGLRKAFCVYWAEQGKSTHQIAAMAGHLTLGEVERYTRAVDRQQIVRLIVEGA
ncbi:tyrosine-type recombinase/integrase [Paracoccus pantotrophus]|uniref:Tyrosine-type recombinase/integrase n=1 Tax=Paracoccus pantotrophus TaxID=82367 RepID=A0A7H9BVA5_PARPN|nr:tyrosine-type recombinase/integrase [Paracoccus pantotrophus]QLH15287.1 tyrosine-type recombinase/integrase [Paracoccus pantotrophus]